MSMKRGPKRMPTTGLVAEIKKHGCSKTACWCHERFTDGGVEVILGNGWWCFLADRHYRNASGCLSDQERTGCCDGIAAYSQTSSRRIRVIEAKTPSDFPESKDPLRCGVEFSLELPSVTVNDISVELHVRDAPSGTIRPPRGRRTLLVDGHAYEIGLYVSGKRQI
jgi:hypothetical protein